jgi:3-hydroxyacyl-[acyl-carrier-protein] dehydratase
MRFFFVDRLLTVEPGVSIEILKNVTTTEDVFEDHFPGHPIMPGALVVETFEQASQLLVALSHDFARVGRLTAVRRAAFRHFVRPGDQLRVRCALEHPRGTGGTLSGPTQPGGAWGAISGPTQPGGTWGAISGPTQPGGAWGAISGPTQLHWTVTAVADVDGRRVASATLELALVAAEGADKEHAERLREVVRVLRAAPIEPGGGLG